MIDLISISQLLSSGLHLIPISLGSKGPRHKDWNLPGHSIGTIAEMQDCDPSRFNWGLHHADSGTCAVDIDNVKEARWEFMRHGLDLDEYLNTHLRIESGNPNHAKLLFRLPTWLGIVASKNLSYTDDANNSRSMIDFRSGVDDLSATKADILPGSWHPDTWQQYRWENDLGLGACMLQEIPGPLLQWWLELLAPEQPEARQDAPTPADADETMVIDALRFVDPDCDRDTWVKMAMALHHALGDAGQTLFDEWSARGTKYAGSQDTEAVWRSIHGRARGITVNSLWSLAEQGGWRDRPPLSEADIGIELLVDFRAILPVTDEDTEKVHAVQQLMRRATRLKNPVYRIQLFDLIKEKLGWSQRRLEEHLRFLRGQEREMADIVPGALLFPYPKQDGTPRDHSENLTALCEHNDIRIRHNRMTHDIEVYDPKVQHWLPDEAANLQRSHIRDLCVSTGMPYQRSDEHINTLGCQNSYHPMEEYLDSLVWDGKDWFQMVADTVQVVDKSLWELSFKRWAISVCAAVREKTGSRPPRGVLVLTGEQLVGKTSWFRYLMPLRPWFGEGTSLDPKDKDSVKKATKYAVVELGELDSTFKKADISKLKAYISSPYDEIRLPYAHTESKWPRRTIYCGTVNDPRFLRDPTGNTRFWTNEVIAIDLDTMEKLNATGWLGQFWAQVNHWLDTGEDWLMNTAEMAAIEYNNDEYLDMDIQEERLLDAYAWPESSGRAWHGDGASRSYLQWSPVNPMTIDEVAASIGLELNRISAEASRRFRTTLLRLTGQRSGSRMYAKPWDHVNKQRDTQKYQRRWYYMPYPVGGVDTLAVTTPKLVILQGGKAVAAPPQKSMRISPNLSAP